MSGALVVSPIETARGQVAVVGAIVVGVAVVLVSIFSANWGWLIGLALTLACCISCAIEAERKMMDWPVAFWISVTGAFIFMSGSAFVYFPLIGYQYRVIDYGNGEMVYTDKRWTAYLVVPFVNPTYAYYPDQSVTEGLVKNSGGFVCTSKTADGAILKSKLTAALTLPFSGLGAAHAVSGNQANLTGLVKRELCNRYVAVIASYKVADLPSHLALAFEAGSRQQYGMNNLGVLYTGSMNISNFELTINQPDIH